MTDKQLNDLLKKHAAEYFEVASGLLVFPMKAFNAVFKGEGMYSFLDRKKPFDKNSEYFIMEYDLKSISEKNLIAHVKENFEMDDFEKWCIKENYIASGEEKDKSIQINRIDEVYDMLIKIIEKQGCATVYYSQKDKVLRCADVENMDKSIYKDADNIGVAKFDAMLPTLTELKTKAREEIGRWKSIFEGIGKEIQKAVQK